MPMDRSREGRRPGLVTASSSSNRFSKRLFRNREVEGQVEVYRGGSKRERDRDSSSRSSKRLSRRGDRSSATEDSVDEDDDDDDYGVEDGGDGGASPSFSRMAPPPHSTTATKIICVSVPKKARSVAVKRSHESLAEASTSAPGGSAKSKLFTPANTWSRKKTKPGGPKTRLPGASKSSSSPVSVVEEDIEIEIAEVLYGLMKQSNKLISKEEEDCSFDNVSHTLESGEAGDFSGDSKPSPVPNNGPSPDPSLGVALKRLKAEEAGSTTPVQNSLCHPAVKDEGEEHVTVGGPLPKLGKSTEANAESGGSKLEEATEQLDSKPETEDSGAATKERALLTEEKVSKCAKLDSELKESVVSEGSSVILEMVNKRQEKFKIDLMAPPPMASSSEVDGLVNLSLDPKPKAHDVELKMETRNRDEEPVVKSVKKESVLIELEEKKIKAVATKSELKLDFEKPNNYIGNSNGNTLQQKQLKSTTHKAEPNTQSSPVPLSFPFANWPNALAPLGCKPPFQTVLPMDKTNGSTIAVQPYFLDPQTRRKRCATHHYIASTIRLHQQFLNMNHVLPAAAASAALLGARPLSNLNAFPSQSVIVGNPLQAGFSFVNSNVAQEKVQPVSNPPSKKEGSSEVSNCGKTPQKKQLSLNQHPQPAPTGNLMHAPAFVFSLGQHQILNQTGPSKSVSSTNNLSGAGNVPGGVVGTSALPVVAAGMSFNYPGLAASESPPYLTILPNGGYTFPISTPIGNLPEFRGGNSSQSLPFLNGSFYPTQILQSPQLPQQQPQSQPLVLPVHQNVIASSGSPSQKQSQSLHLRGAPVGSNNYIMGSVLSQNPPKQHMASRESEANKRVESALIPADTQASHSQRIVHGQNLMIPLRPNFALMASNGTCVGGGVSGNRGDKKNNQSQEKSFKGGVDIVPSQAFAMSSLSFNGTNAASNVKFSSLPQNPAILQSLPNMAGQGYQVVAAPQATLKKNHQPSGGNTGGSSANPDNGRKHAIGKSSSSTMHTLVFNNSARSLNFMSSPFGGNWTSFPISSTTNAPITANFQNSHQPQQQLLQFEKQQYQQDSDGSVQSKAPSTYNLPSSFIGFKFPSANPVFSQTLVQNNSSSQDLQWKNSPKTQASQAPLSPIMQSEQHQISFGGNYRLALASQGHQTPAGNPYISVSGSPQVGNSRMSSKSTKANSSVPLLQSQKNDNSSTGSSQNSSAACGRDVPSILSRCPGQLSELKY